MTEDEKKVAYMQILQANINRMSTASAIIKGFAATIVAGITSANIKETYLWMIGLLFLPMLTFLALDVYYLMLEHRYRFMYDAVRTGLHVVDFSMKPVFVNYGVAHASRRLLKEIWICFRSPSIWLFYPLLITIMIISSRILQKSK